MKNKITVVHCKRNPVNEYIGRPSPLGNPFPWDKNTPKGSTLERYEVWLNEQIEQRIPVIINELNRLLLLAREGDLNLGCWCAPQVCHGDVIKKKLEERL